MRELNGFKGLIVLGMQVIDNERVMFGIEIDGAHQPVVHEFEKIDGRWCNTVTHYCTETEIHDG